MRRILSIDGGGIKGVFAASFLATVEERLKLRILDYFDLIVGSSTGGIIALALGLEILPKDILSFYQRYGAKIFPRIMFQRFRLPRIDAKALDAAVKGAFGDRPFRKDCKTLLAIPATDSEHHKPYTFKTRHREELCRDEHATTVQVVRGTTAVPLSLSPYNLPSGNALLDGGMWANNPVAFAVVEAVNLKWWPREDVRVLSLGCTGSIKYRWNSTLLKMLLWERGEVIEALLAIQGEAAMTMARNLLDDDRQLVRIDPMPTKRIRLNDVSQIDYLRDCGVEKAEQNLTTLEERFFSGAKRVEFGADPTWGPCVEVRITKDLPATFIDGFDARRLKLGRVYRVHDKLAQELIRDGYAEAAAPFALDAKARGEPAES
jgi:predicted acylesterase/phospholipase RssA